MTASTHDRFRDDVAAYLLGALSDTERDDFERHLAECAQCREEAERLRPAAEALPRSVDPLEPRRELKQSLMAVVSEEARAQGGPEHRARRTAAPARRGPRRLLPAWGPRLAWAPAALLLLAAAAGGFALGSRVGGEDPRTIAVAADRTQVPRAHGTLSVTGDGEDGAILRVSGLPSVRSGVYQAWVQRGEEVLPQPTFEVGESGVGAVAVPADLSEADAVLVTREPRGGSRAPSEDPLLRARL